MVRPTIRRKNLFLSYLARARTLTRAWTKRYTGIEAVMLTGGVSRGYADEMSELDLTLFLRPATYRLWIERCHRRCPRGTTSSTRGPSTSITPRLHESATRPGRL